MIQYAFRNENNNSFERQPVVPILDTKKKEDNDDLLDIFYKTTSTLTSKDNLYLDFYGMKTNYHIYDDEIEEEKNVPTAAPPQLSSPPAPSAPKILPRPMSSSNVNRDENRPPLPPPPTQTAPLNNNIPRNVEISRIPEKNIGATIPVKVEPKIGNFIQFILLNGEIIMFTKIRT